MSEIIQATWSNAARKAAAEARNAKRTWEDRGPNEDRGSFQILHHEHGDNDFSDATLHTRPKAGKYKATVTHKGSAGSIKISHGSLAEVKKAAESHLKRNYSDVGNARVSYNINSSDEGDSDAVQSNTSNESADVVRAAGTSEGNKKGWETRKSVGPIDSDAASEHLKEASRYFSGDESEKAHLQSAKAFTSGKASDHKLAAKFHRSVASNAYSEARGAANREVANHHIEMSKHEDAAKASDTALAEVIHCRSHSASGPVLAADKPWSPGEQVSFMWMPAGTSTICAGFRKGSIELTVNCDENTAAAVQASLESWREERPKQEPFGCIEHKEQEASFRVGASCGFKWNEDGVYLAAEPTTLGAQNVNGRVHRSWSPSFTTDADYSKATERNGVLMFPEGARGSRSNPAQITGVDFCVGTLTNKPAFHSMSPVKASDAVQAGGKPGDQNARGPHSKRANDASDVARKATIATEGRPTMESHGKASEAHYAAAGAHEKAVEMEVEPEVRKFHHEAAAHHYSKVDFHERQMVHMNRAARASDAITPDTILAQQAEALNKANVMATEMGVARTKLDEIHEVITAASDTGKYPDVMRNQRSGSDADPGQSDEFLSRELVLDIPDYKDFELAFYISLIKSGRSRQSAVTMIKSSRAMESSFGQAKPSSHDLLVEHAADAQGVLDKIYASAGHSTNVVKAHCGKLLGMLGSLRAAHWNAPTQTNDHEALGELYETLDGLVDEYVESSMGKKPEKVTPESCDCDPNDPAAVLDAGEKIVTGMRGDRDDLNNIVADMEKAINKTRYLLKAGAAGGLIQTSDKSVGDTLESIYARAETVTAAGTSEGEEAVKTATGAFAPGHPFYGNKYSKLTQRASFQAYAHGDSLHHAKASDAHHEAMADHMKESKKYPPGSEERHAHLEAVGHHLKESQKHAEKAASLKATDATPQDILESIYARAGESR